ncbi:hypothetical protein [Bacillus dakarensis]|uniref:hypothetical protein n=1 Tax=Robertmurraya dakarensis TaxID=1926278 RepID=UPI0011154951|nr:hypothetical protein [Bacillus dakarensis]
MSMTKPAFVVDFEYLFFQTTGMIWSSSRLMKTSSSSQRTSNGHHSPDEDQFLCSMNQKWSSFFL